MANRVQIKGMAETLAKLKNLGSRAAARRVLRKAVRAGTNPILADARANAPRDKDDLRKSLTKKIIVNNFRCQGIVGADADYVGEDGQKPAHYDHLVEYGHEEDGKVTPPHPFMRETADQSMSAGQEKFEETLAREYEAEAIKAAEK